jgi:flagellar motility protein MotE (MotC chaperone)
MIIRMVVCALGALLITVNLYAQDDIASLIEKQRLELVQKEENIKREVERLKILKKEVEEDIVKYTNLLKQIEKSLQQAEDIGNKRLRHVAKAYEAMSPEDAASRLSGLDKETAVQILLKMNSKKAGLVMGMMETKKATQLTRELAKLKK